MAVARAEGPRHPTHSPSGWPSHRRSAARFRPGPATEFGRHPGAMIAATAHRRVYLRSERSIKPFVIGRKNWLFSNAPRGAKASATIYSLMETAKENGLNPFPYLQYLLERCPTSTCRTKRPWMNYCLGPTPYRRFAGLVPRCLPASRTKQLRFTRWVQFDAYGLGPSFRSWFGGSLVNAPRANLFSCESEGRSVFACEHRTVSAGGVVPTWLSPLGFCPKSCVHAAGCSPMSTDGNVRSPANHRWAHRS